MFKDPDKEIEIGTHIENFPTIREAIQYANAWSAFHRQKTKVTRMHYEGRRMFVIVCDSPKIPVLCTYLFPGECPSNCINRTSPDFTSIDLCVLAERE